MKTSIAVSLFLVALAPGQAAEDAAYRLGLADQMGGTWVLPVDGGAVRYKFVGDGKWTVTQPDGSGGVLFHHGGHFTLDGNHYREIIDYALPNTASLIGQEFGYEIEIVGDQWIQEGIGNPFSETWKRVSISTESIWGTQSDADGDCVFTIEGDTLKIQTPGGENPHDLAADVGVVNAPRSLWPIEGDFTVTLQVGGEFGPGEQSTLVGRTPYNGAGIVLVNDSDNVVTLARAALQLGTDAYGYANFEMREDGNLVRFGTTGDAELPVSGTVFLRMQRRGDTLHGAVGTDGEAWTELDPKMIPEEWPEKLQVGVAVISTSEDAFEATFSNLQVTD